MKKTVSFLLAFSLILMCGALAACQQQSAYSVVKGAFDKMQTMDAISAEMEMDYKIAMDGLSISVPMTFEIKALNGETPEMYMQMEASFMGESLEMEYYQKGEWAYTVSNGVGTKTKVDDTENDSEDNDFFSMPSEELLEDVKLVKNDDGTQQISFDLPGEEIPSFVMSFFEGMGLSGVTVEDPEDMKAEATITIKDGYLYKYEMEIETEMKAADQTADAEISWTFKLDKPGTKVTITPPEGYLSFPEVGGSATGV